MQIQQSRESPPCNGEDDCFHFTEHGNLALVSHSSRTPQPNDLEAWKDGCRAAFICTECGEPICAVSPYLAALALLCRKNGHLTLDTKLSHGYVTECPQCGARCEADRATPPPVKVELEEGSLHT